MTLDHEDIAAIAAQVVELLAPMLQGASKAIPTPIEPEEEAGGMGSYAFTMLMSQPDLLGAIRAREKRLREERKHKAPKKRKAA